ncbi:probable ATP-dependent RNA helicase DHX37 [Mytilus trossulus]|uniref:probable ATP-dependent RNA helicase DHX37 n=1 Tax=Mytilus trossulus TaxID=6551 RepID=UPI0030056A5F
MGKRKGGFNWKARQHNDTVVDRSGEKKIKLDPEIEASIKDDESNILVLPSEKRKSKTVIQTTKKVKQLSKKERKRLQQVLERKKKKTRRAELLDSLSKVQASTEELKQFASVAEMQTGKFKRKLNEKKMDAGEINSVAKGKKKSIQMNVDESDDGNESDSSVHTSDMSTDEESDSDDQSQVQGQTEDSGCDIEDKNNVTMETETNAKIQNEKKAETSEVKEKSVLKSTADNDTSKEKMDKKPAVNIPVQRLPEMQESRLKLPILSEEQSVMETINDNMVTIICGETGSGKTTQVPQFLYEAGYAHTNGIIAVTEPRRVAAISMSNRVAKELNLTEREVSYQIRYEGNVTPDTKIKFMTDGVLLKEVQKDFLLTKYSVVIIDEAHERSVYTDILIGLLSRIVPLRNKQGNRLKLIIMSATLRVEDFTENRRLFKIEPPVVKVDSRQFPVTIHFNKRTPLEDYLGEAFKKVCKIHRTLPEGGILVFVTGQQEVHTLCKKLRQTFPFEGNSETKAKKSRRKKKESKTEILPKINLDNYSIEPVDEEAEREADDSDQEIEDHFMEGDDEDVHTQLGEDLQTGGTTEPLYVLPLYSLLSKEKQSKVFDPPPKGCRLCVVATNVAETSLTIPDIKYVVDTGKVKTKFYDKVTGVSTFKITWTSKASGNQRAGRAGRTGPGHCYRLYSSAVYNDDFEKFSLAEIIRRPVDDLVLQMKYMNIDRIVNFPFPTPPDDEQVKAAETLLVSLGALTEPIKSVRMKDLKKTPITKITPLGKVMACFPVSPRYAKMLALGHQHDLLSYVVAIVAGLSVQEVFIEIQKPPDTDQEQDDFRSQIQYMSQVKKLWAGTGHSMLLGDLMVLLKAIGSAEYQGCTIEFCQKHGLRYKAMKEVRKLRAQLTNTVNMVIPDANICLDPKLKPPSDIQAKLIRQIILAGLADHVARRFPDPPPDADETLKKRKHAYQCTELDEPVFIHPFSVLYKQKPEFIVYQHIEETSKLYMKGISAIESEWLPVYAPSFCTLSKPQEDPPPSYDKSKDQIRCHMTSTFSRCCWEVPSVDLEYPANLDKYRWFARFLLEGAVVSGMKKYVTMLLSSPSTMVKSWAKLQPRTEKLLKELVAAGVDSKETLLKAWQKDPKYLLNTFCQWVPQSKHTEIEMTWPPVK